MRWRRIPPRLGAGAPASPRGGHSGDLEIAWNGGLGDSVEVVVGSRDGSGPTVRSVDEVEVRLVSRSVTQLWLEPRE